MKPIRVFAGLFFGVLLHGCSDDTSPISTGQSETSQPPVTSTLTEPSTGQRLPDSAVPPATALTAPMASAGTETLIEGLNLRGLNEAFAQARAAYDSSPQDAAAATRFINLIEELGISLSQQGNRERGNKAFMQAVELLDSALKADVKIDAQISSLVYYNGGCAKALENQAEDAMVLLERAMDHGYRNFDQLRADADLEVVRAMPGFAEKLAAWEAKAREAALEQANAEAVDADRRDEAVKRGEEALTRSRSKFGQEHPFTIAEMTNLAAAYVNAGRLDEAIQLREVVLALYRKLHGPEHFHTVLAMVKLADSYNDAGWLDEEVKLREELLTIFRKASGPEHPNTLKAMTGLLYLYHSAGRHDEAFKLAAELLALTPDDAVAHNQAAWNLVTIPDKEGRYPNANQAVTWARRSCELSPDNAALMNTLGVALYRTEHWQEASDTLQKSVELGADVPHNWLFIAMSHWQLDQKDKAKEWYDKSLTMQRAARFDPELHGFFAEAAKLMDPNSEGESGATEPKP